MCNLLSWWWPHRCWAGGSCAPHPPSSPDSTSPNIPKEYIVRNFTDFTTKKGWTGYPDPAMLDAEHWTKVFYLVYDTFQMSIDLSFN